MKSKKSVIVSGKRKTSVTKVSIKEGSGRITYNHLPHAELRFFHRLALEEPVKIYNEIMGKQDFEINISTARGGKEGQIQAARLGIAKALLEFSNSEELRKAFVSYDRHLLVADNRRKETRKPGDSKARAKRQTSYR